MSDSSFSQSSVSLAVWPWTQVRETSGRKLTPVFVQALIPLTVAAVLYFWAPFGHAQTVAKVVACVGILLCVIGLTAPKLFHKIEGCIWGFVHFIGLALSWILLVPLFYTFFLGARILLTLRGKDPLHRKLEPDAPSYWVIRERVADPKSYYRRQF